MKNYIAILCALLIGCLVNTAIPQDRVCINGQCYDLPSQERSVVTAMIDLPVRVVQAPVNVVRSVVQNQPVRRVFANRPVRKLFQGKPVRRVLGVFRCR